MTNDMDDIKVAAGKMAVGGVGAIWYSLTLNEWVAVLTIIYMVLQIGLLIPKYFRLFFKGEK